MKVAPDVLSQGERQRLLLSVGTHRGERPLSPVEVANLYTKMINAGASLSDCARASNLEGTTWVGRFLQLLKLPEAVRHLVVFGGGAGTISFSTAAEVARLEDHEEEEALVQGALTHRLSGSEVRQVVQLRRRSKRSLQECLTEVIGMRPRVEKRFLYVGAITDARLKYKIGAMSQHERDQLLQRAIDAVLGANTLTLAKLGSDRFTLVGAAAFGEKMSTKKDSLEQEINDALGHMSH